jgi:adenosylcobinamide-GDP ribazoletransferase
VSSREDWQKRLGPLYGGAVALVSSTSWRWPTEVSDDARSPGWVVALGLPVGLVAWVIAALAHAAGVPANISAIFGLAALSAASALIVERGLAQRVDHWMPADDSRSNASSVFVVVIVTVIRALAIAAVPPSQWMFVFLATAVLGRWSAVFLQAIGDPITRDDGRRSLVATPSPMWLTAAISVGVAALTILALGKAGIVALALAAIASFTLGLEAQRRDGGLSAPVVATAAAIGETLVLLVATTLVR